MDGGRALNDQRGLTRRRFLAGVGGVAVVIGFDPMGRRWVSRAEAASCPSFADVPALEGTLYLDQATRDDYAGDLGNIVRRTPCAVLLPGSITDIQKMIRFSRQHQIRVAARGQGHGVYGNGLTGGLIIDSRSMDLIHSIGSGGADVDAGVTWRRLLEAAFAQGLRPPVLTGYAGLSVGGVLSVGGTSGVHAEGAKVDHAQELTVVTGAGDVVRCNPRHRRDLFEATLAGLGQFSVIARVKFDLVPVPPSARSYMLEYTDNASFFRDMRMLLNRGELPYIFNLWVPTGRGWVYQLNASIFFDPSNPPDDEYLLRGLSVPPQAAVARTESFLDVALFVDKQIEAYRATLQYDDVVKPWSTLLIPDSAVEQYIAETIPTLTAVDVGPTGFLLLFAMDRAALTRPFFRVPDPAVGRWVYQLGVLTSSAGPGPDQAFADVMLERNRQLFERARGVGGTRYPIDATPFSQKDWIAHYGETWPEFVRRKQRFDPNNILTPGPGIFT